MSMTNDDAELLQVVELVEAKHGPSHAPTLGDAPATDGFSFKRDLLRAVANVCCDDATVVEQVCSLLCLFVFSSPHADVCKVG